MPIGFARSAAGEYTFSIFAVVAIALIASWVVAVVFAPLLGVWILKKPKAVALRASPARSCARSAASSCWRCGRAGSRSSLTLGLFGAALYGMRFVPQQFFPSSDRPELLVDLQLPENASIYATRDVSARLDKLLKGDPDVDHWSTYVGQGAVRFYLPLNVQLPNDFFAQAVVVTKGLEQRERVKAKLEQALATDFPSVVGRVYPLELGPPVGWPLQYRVSGPEPDQVRAIAFKVAQVMGTTPAVRNVNYNWMEPARTVRIRVDQDQARLLGLSSQDLAQALNTVVSGVTATQMRSGIYLVDVLVRASAEQRMSLSTIRTLQVPLPNGRTVPLSQIASVEYGQEYPHRLAPRPEADRDGAGRCRARHAGRHGRAGPGAEDGGAECEPAERLPHRRRRNGRGEQQGADLGRRRPAADARPDAHGADDPAPELQPPVPGAQRGPSGSHRGRRGPPPLRTSRSASSRSSACSRSPGMIARNSVILIDQIETEKAHGRHPWDAVVEATAHRFRPILLTAAAAILGMIPIAPTIFWGPMAYAIMGGLAVATLLTLVFLPALYVTWFRIKRPHPDASQEIGSSATRHSSGGSPVRC